MLKVARTTFAVACFSEACKTSMSTQVAFKWFHIPLTSRPPAVIHQMNEFGYEFSCFVRYVVVIIAPMDATYLVLVQT